MLVLISSHSSFSIADRIFDFLCRSRHSLQGDTGNSLSVCIISTLRDVFIDGLNTFFDTYFENFEIEANFHGITKKKQTKTIIIIKSIQYYTKGEQKESTEFMQKLRDTLLPA